MTGDCHCQATLLAMCYGLRPTLSGPCVIGLTDMQIMALMEVWQKLTSQRLLTVCLKWVSNLAGNE